MSVGSKAMVPARRVWNDIRGITSAAVALPSRKP
jgi:hypothetical protein